MELVKYLLSKGVDEMVVSEEHGSALQVAAGVLRNGSPRPGFGAYRNEELTTYLWKRSEDLVRIVGDKKQAGQSSTTCELILHRFCDTKIVILCCNLLCCHLDEGPGVPKESEKVEVPRSENKQCCDRNFDMIRKKSFVVLSACGHP